MSLQANFTKLERLMRKHLRNLTIEDTPESLRHKRALRRLRKTATFKSYSALCRAEASHRRSEYLLRITN